MRLGINNVPGWLIAFGNQDPIKDAFTITRTSPPNPNNPNPQPPSVTHQDAVATAPSFQCALTAPGVYAPGGRTFSNNGVLSLNYGFYPFDSNAAGTLVNITTTNYTIELVVPGSAATENPPAAAVLPVYRVTLPDDAGLILSLTASYMSNGQTTASDRRQRRF